MIRYLTAGESHGKKLTTILDGFPAGLPLSDRDIDSDLAQRQKGYGRSERQRIEQDRADITSGVRHGKTTGAPITIEIVNSVFEKQIEIWNDPTQPKMSIPRPGHADFAGWAKYEGTDIRNVVERSSARETAARVAACAVAKALIAQFNVKWANRVINIGGVTDELPFEWKFSQDYRESELATVNPEIEELWRKKIKEAIDSGDSVGGEFECRFQNLPIGIGSFDQWDRRLDGKIAGAVMSVQGIKAISIGDGAEAASFSGSSFRDAFFTDEKCRDQVLRRTNHAGGIEGGVTNGEDLIVRAVMKPIPGVKISADSIDTDNGKMAQSWFERADSCVVRSAALIAESVIAWELADALRLRYGGDTLEAMLSAFKRDQDGWRNHWKQ